MDRLVLGLLTIQTIVFVLAVFGFFKLYRQVSELKSSFAKLGFVVRQDLQQHFETAAQKTIEVQQQSSQHNQQLIEQTMQKVLNESSRSMQEILARAEGQASEIVLKAHQDRQRILDDAREESKQYVTRLTDYSTEALEWALEQLVKEKMDLGGHEQLIESLVSVYINEHKRN